MFENFKNHEFPEQDECLFQTKMIDLVPEIYVNPWVNFKIMELLDFIGEGNTPHLKKLDLNSHYESKMLPPNVLAGAAMMVETLNVWRLTWGQVDAILTR